MKSEIERFLSDGDRAMWARLEDGILRTRIASDVYNLIDPKGRQTAVIGPGVAPKDVLTIQMCYSVGPSGHVFAIDPQGNRKSEGQLVVQFGNASVYENDIAFMRQMRFPFAPFTWLGPESSLVNIPAHNLDLIADHGTVEFVGSDKRAGAAYVQKGLETIIGALRVGGMFVHQGTGDLYKYVGTSEAVWFKQYGMRVMFRTLESDSYRLRINPDVLDDFFATDGPERVFSAKDADDIRLRRHGDILELPESMLDYPARDVIIAQKLYE